MLSDTLTRIDALKAAFEALQPLKPEYEQRLWQKLRLEWNYNSNHIEGNTLTYGETFLLLVHGQTHGGHSMREFEEMKAHDVAVSMVKAWSADKERPLNENDVRSLNAVLLKEPFWKEAITADGQPTRIEVIPGQYKKTGNVVRQPDGSLFHYANPDEVPVRMQELMAWYSSSNDLHPVQKAAILHHRFIVIHPFGDGNGRTARLLVNYHLMRHGLMPLVVKSADKANYLRCLKLADAGDLTPFAEYLAEAEVWALELAIRAAKGESIEEASDWEKRLQLITNHFQNQDPNEVVQRTFNKEVLFDIYDTWIGKLFENLISVLQKFHHLFFGMRHHINVMEVGGQEPYRTRSSAANVDFIEEPASAVVQRLRVALEKSSASWNSGGAEFSLHPHLGSYKHLHERAFGCVYFAEVRIDFHHWEVWGDEFDNGDSKRKPVLLAKGLLHQPLLQIQIDDIAQRYGKAITDHIEYWVARGGMEPDSTASKPT